MQSRGCEQFLTVTPRGPPSRAALNGGPWGMSFEQMFIDVTPKDEPFYTPEFVSTSAALRWYARMIVSKPGGQLSPDGMVACTPPYPGHMPQ
eukprot:m51a1_g1812 hypothetical protein (92) ;mRNA; r:484455-484883